MLKISQFQSRVYSLCSQIPKGKVSTYEGLAKRLGTSPRAVGQSLKKNPFSSSSIPCHRVIAKNLYLGGYRGKWGKGKEVLVKEKKLNKEGIFFDKKGYLFKELKNKVI